MRKNFFLAILVTAGVGCAGVRSPTPPAAQPAETSAAQEKVPITGEAEPVVLGMVFAKTVFEGVAKTSFVELSILDEAEGKKVYELVIGDKARQVGFPWQTQTVKPGYFFIDLPAGLYRIESISIPVGSTRATEAMDLSFTVSPDQNTYLGTLKITGTKERIRLGGFPVIKPGFEYTAEVIDERTEAFRELKARFPDLQKETQVRLMEIHPLPQAEKNIPEQANDAPPSPPSPIQ